MSGKLFTVALPVRNGGEYLKPCIESVLGQTRADFDLVVLDNASSDGTAEYLGTLRDARVTVQRSDQALGIEESWARILQIPKNEFLTIIGHDDLLDPLFLETIHRLIQRHPQASLYQTHFRLLDASGHLVRSCQPIPERESAAEFLATRLQGSRDTFGTGYVMRSADYEAVGGIPLFPNLLFADDVLWFSLTARGYKAADFGECFAYRAHLESTSAKSVRADFVAALEPYLRFLAEFRTRDDSITQALDRYGPGNLREVLRFCYSGLLHHDLRRVEKQRQAGKFRERAAQLYAHALPSAAPLVFSGRTIQMLEKFQLLPPFAGHFLFWFWRGLQLIRVKITNHSPSSV